MGFAVAQLLRFAWLEARCCAFAVAVFGGLALSKIVPLPIPRYDALLIYCVLVTVVFRLVGWETTRDILAIAGFHLIGLAFELVKVPLGSWTYAEPAWTKILGVPLYSGFLYAAVGSYLVAAWRLFDLRVSGYRAVTTAVVAAAIYVNLITHHWLPDLRWPLAGLLVAVTWGTTVHFTVGGHRYRMPLALSFALIGSSCGWRRTSPRSSARGATRTSWRRGGWWTRRSSARGQCSSASRSYSWRRSGHGRVVCASRRSEVLRGAL